MARDIWAETGEVETTGEYVASNKSDPIPDGTKCLSCIEDVKWHKFDNSTHEILNITWRVIEGEYDDKVYFQKIKINGEDPSSNFYKEDKQEKIIDLADKMFRAIDKNAGGSGHAGDAGLSKALSANKVGGPLGGFGVPEGAKGGKADGAAAKKVADNYKKIRKALDKDLATMQKKFEKY